MPANYVLLERVTLTSSTATVVFDSIPSTGYTDLLIRVSARTARGTEEDGLYMVANGVNSTGFRDLEGNGSSASSVSTASYGANWVSRVNGNGATSNAFGSADIYICNYAGSGNKTITAEGVSENNATLAYLNFTSSLWSNSSAITSLSFGCNANFLANTVISLYGVAAVGVTPVIAPKATGGDIVINDGTYWYHAFLSSGTFTPSSNLTCDALVVAGGGGGNLSSASAGGSGAGGLLTFTSQSFLANTNYAATVGAGGVGCISASGSYSATRVTTNGSNSRLGSLTDVVGGGAGGGYSISGGRSGGSGGGGETNAGVGGAGTSGQGNAGGTAGTGGSFYSGSGGGAGAAGGNGSSGLVAGGIGATSALITSMGNATGTGILSSSNRYFAGGGGNSSNGAGGGAGGIGGGGAGASTNQASGGAGTANTGGGAGGGSNTEAFAITANNGGSGIIIVRYLVA